MILENETFKVTNLIQKDINQFLQIELSQADGSLKLEEINKLTQFTKTLANHLRDLRLRDSIGQSLVIPHTLNTLERLIHESNSKQSKEIIESIEQLMRVIGNLVHTHDINRSKVLSLNASKIFNDLINLKYFKDLSNLANLIQPNLNCLQIILTVLFNLCFEYVPAHIAYIEIGIIESLSYFVEHIGEIHCEIPLLSIRLLDEIFSTDESKQMIPNEILVGLLSPTFFIQSNKLNSREFNQIEISSFIESFSLTTSILESITETFKPLQKSLKSLSIFTFKKPITIEPINPPELLNTVNGRLLYFIRFNELPNHWLKEEEEEEEEESLMNVMNKSKANLSKVLININGIEPEEEEEEEEWLIKLLLRWVSEIEVIENRPDLIITIGILLGNISCSDLKSIKLIQDYKILNPLLKVFKVWSSDDLNEQILKKSRFGEQVQVLHSLIGLTRNLAVPDQNKEILGNSGLIELTLKFLSNKFDIVEPLIGLTLGFLRHVCKRNLSNVLRLISKPNLGLEKLIKLKKRNDQMFIKLEVIRLISSSINSIYSQKLINHSLNSDEILNEINLLNSIDIIECLIDLLKIGIQNNLLLINEALVSLTILACNHQSAYRLAGLMLNDNQQVNGKEDNGKEDNEREDNDKEENENEKEEKEKEENGMNLVLKCWLELKKTKQENQLINEMKEKDSILKEEEEIKKIKDENELRFYEIIKKNSMILIKSLMKTLKNQIKENKVDDLVDQNLLQLNLIKDVLKSLKIDKLSEIDKDFLNDLLMI